MNVETIETMSHLVKSTEKSTSPTEGRNLSCRKKKQETVRDRGRVRARKIEGSDGRKNLFVE